MPRQTYGSVRVYDPLPKKIREFAEAFDLKASDVASRALWEYLSKHQEVFEKAREVQQDESLDAYSKMQSILRWQGFVAGFPPDMPEELVQALDKHGMSIPSHRSPNNGTKNKQPVRR